MIVSKPLVGSTIEARCTKCCQTLPHEVISLAETCLDQVQCQECGHTHKIKAEPKPKVAAPNETIAAKEWQQLQPDFDAKKAVKYSMTANYPEETLINHPTLGLGLVRRMAGSHTMEVLFENGMQLMRCNGGLK